MGAQGTQGTQGVQGSLGTQGATGTFGGETHEYNFLTDTTNTDPGNGNLKFNNATIASATVLYIDNVDFNTNDITQLLQTIDDSTSGIKGTIKFTEVGDPNSFAFFQITGTHTHESGGAYFSVPVAYVTGTLSVVNNDNVYVTFARVGDKGDTGAQGTQGTQGVQGTLGVQGVQGVQGTQGFTGATGAQGTQGVQGTTGTGTQGTQGAQGIGGVQGSTGTAAAGGSIPDILMLGAM